MNIERSISSAQLRPRRFFSSAQAPLSCGPNRPTITIPIPYRLSTLSLLHLHAGVTAPYTYSYTYSYSVLAVDVTSLLCGLQIVSFASCPLSKKIFSAFIIFHFLYLILSFQFFQNSPLFNSSNAVLNLQYTPRKKFL